MRKLPWYSFLYRLLGAQGTFWLWLIVPLTLWWTFEPAMIRLANRKPLAVGVVDAGKDPIARWITVEGVKVAFDARLLMRPNAPGLPPANLLLDFADPAAVWWSETRALTDPASGTSLLGAQGGIAGCWPVFARKQLVRRFAKLEGDPGLYHPAPARALLLNDPLSPPLSAAPPKASGGSTLSAFSGATNEQIELVRERVEVVATVQGVLDVTPPVLSRRLHEELGLTVPERALDVGRRPRELESVVFGVAAILLLFLVVGLYGAREIPAPRVEPV